MTARQYLEIMMLAQIRCDYFKIVVERRLKTFEMFDPVKIAHYMVSDATHLKSIFVTTFLALVMTCATVLSYPFILVKINWKLTLLIAAKLPLAAIISKYYGDWSRGMMNEVVTKMSNISATGVKWMMNLRIIKANVAEKKAFKDFQKTMDAYIDVLYRYMKVSIPVSQVITILDKVMQFGEFCWGRCGQEESLSSLLLC